MATTATSAIPEEPFPVAAKLGFVLAGVGLLVLVAAVPQGETPSRLRGQLVEDPATGETRWVRDLDPAFAAGLNLGYVSGYLLLASLLLGHSHPLTRRLPGLWRTRLHVAVGVLLLAAGLAHGLLLATLGAVETWPSGVASVAVLAAHGASGVWKTRLVPRWGPARWRFQHLWTAYLGLALGLVHGLVV